MSSQIRKNGFSIPLNGQQVGSWVVSMFNLLMSAVIFMPTLPLESQVNYNQVAFGIIFYFSQFFVIVLAVIATGINPADPFIKDKLKSNEPIECEVGQSICTICNSTIGALSKHCGACNKCIENFDHHCKWLNNCIGIQNYKYFIALLWSLLINILTLIIFSIILFSEYQNNFNDFDKRVNNPQVYIAFVAITFVVSLIILIGCSYLISFHTYLKCKGISTFDYILMKREKQERLENGGRGDAPTPSDNSREENEKSKKRKEKKKNEDIVIEFQD